MYKNILIIGIFFLFGLSTINSVAIYFDSINSQDDKLECLLENLRFTCTTPNGFNKIKYEYYKERLQNQYLSIYRKETMIIEHDNKDLKTQLNPPSYPISSANGPMDSPWSMKCHDAHHTSQSPYSTTNNQYIEKWRFYFSDWLEDTPVIDNNGTIYCKGAHNVLDHLYAIYPNGTEKWKYKVGGLILGSSPAIDDDGTIYIGCWDTGLYAINPDGTKKWRIGLGGSIASSPAIAEDGTIYVGTMSTGNFIVAVNPNGTKKWNYKTGFHVTSCPVISDDGTIYCGSGDTYLYALYPNGTLKWRFKTGAYIKGPASIADDGTVYTGSYDGYLYALYPNNGTMKWKCRIGDGSETNPSIANDGTIYIGGNYLYAVYPNNGTLKWRFDIPGFIHTSSPAISSDGTIYFGTDDSGYIYVVNSNGTERWRKKIAHKWVESSPAIAEDGTVYIGSSVDMSRGYLHAFGSIESNSPPSTPVINGPTQVNAREMNWFTFRSVDPDRNPLRLYVDWGDGNSGWIGSEWASGEKMWREYAWDTPCSITIKAKVKDVMEEESDWGYFDVIVPRHKAVSREILLQKLLERFPLLQHFMIQ